nr:MAG TPA: hypothetical protein [Caudoviricetes sp.]
MPVMRSNNERKIITTAMCYLAVCHRGFQGEWKHP